MFNLIAIIQARTGSTRLPGKVLRKIGNKSLIDLVLARVNKLAVPHGPLESIIVVTSSCETDDLLVSHIEKKWPAIRIVRGPVEDVLGRFVSALRKYPSKNIVRITGDCPLVNLDAIMRMHDEHCRAAADITNYRPGYEYADKGVELVSSSAIFRADAEPGISCVDREHVTSYIYSHPENYSINYIDSEDFLKRSDIRLTVDTESDLLFIKELYKKYGEELESIDLKTLLDCLDNNHEYKSINCLSNEKSTMHENQRILFRCDGGTEIGMGHIAGSIRLAKLLARELGAGVEFLTKGNKEAVEIIQQAGFAASVLPENSNSGQDMGRVIDRIGKLNIAAVVCNFNKEGIESNEQFFNEIKNTKAKLVFMDNPVPPSCYTADILINALPHPNYPGYSPASHPHCYEGLEYFLLGDLFECYRNKNEIPSKTVNRVLVSLGGADSPNITSLILDGLNKAGFKGHVDVVLGIANPHREVIENKISSSGLKGEITFHVGNLPSLMREADIGFSSLGLTTYEMAFMGLPAIIVCGSRFNARVAELYSKKYKYALNLGFYSKINPDSISNIFQKTCDDFAWRGQVAELRGKNIGTGKKEIVEAFRTLIFGGQNDCQ